MLRRVVLLGMAFCIFDKYMSYKMIEQVKNNKSIRLANNLSCDKRKQLTSEFIKKYKLS